MSKRLDYNQIAPNGAKALGRVYGYVMQSGLPADIFGVMPMDRRLHEEGGADLLAAAGDPCAGRYIMRSRGYSS